MDKPTILYPVIVEGKYDKIKLDSLFEAKVLTTGGFGVFNSAEKREFFRRLAEKTPLIVLADSDGAGNLIRRFFKDAIPKERLIELYIPPTPGKERRKRTPSKEGLLGVEGMDRAVLTRLLSPYFSEPGKNAPQSAGLTRAELYDRGYIGGENSAEKRRELCLAAGLPTNLSTTALIDALNLLWTRKELDELLKI